MAYTVVFAFNPESPDRFRDHFGDHFGDPFGDPFGLIRIILGQVIHCPF